MIEGMDLGYIKVWRKIKDNHMIKKPMLFTFWIWCLLKATHTDYAQKVGEKTIILNRGQFIFGTDSAKKQLGLTEQNIRTCIKNLTKSKCIKRETHNKYSIITVINYDTYAGEQTEDQHPRSKNLTPKNEKSNTQEKIVTVSKTMACEHTKTEPNTQDQKNQHPRMKNLTPKDENLTTQHPRMKNLTPKNEKSNTQATDVTPTPIWNYGLRNQEPNTQDQKNQHPRSKKLTPNKNSITRTSTLSPLPLSDCEAEKSCERETFLEDKKQKHEDTAETQTTGDSLLKESLSELDRSYIPQSPNYQAAGRIITYFKTQTGKATRDRRFIFDLLKTYTEGELKKIIRIKKTDPYYGKNPDALSVYNVLGKRSIDAVIDKPEDYYRKKAHKTPEEIKGFTHPETGKSVSLAEYLQAKKDQEGNKSDDARRLSDTSVAGY